MNILKVIYHKIPDPVRVRVCYPILRVAYYLKQAKKLRDFVKLGDKNPDKKIIILYTEARYCGLFSIIYYLRYTMRFALQKNYKVVVDLSQTDIKEARTYPQEQSNPWDLFFEQPDGISMEEAKHSAHVLRLNSDVLSRFHTNVELNTLSKRNVHREHVIFARYVRPTVELMNYIESQPCTEIIEEKKVLAVSIRSNYRWGELIRKPLYNNHPKVPAIGYFIDHIKDFFEKSGYDYFFLSCDDGVWRDRLVEEFGEKCLYIDRPLGRRFTADCETAINMFDSDWKPIPEKQEELVGDLLREPYVKGQYEYLAEVWLMSRCTSLFGTESSGTQFAQILNDNQYEEVMYYDGGLISV